jgi:hypothetical protein
VIIHTATKVVNILETNTMNTKIIHLEMPQVLPHGWKQDVATTLGIHPNTVTNALKEGKGDTYDRIMKCAKERYGKPVTSEAV